MSGYKTNERFIYWNSLRKLLPLSLILSIIILCNSVKLQIESHSFKLMEYNRKINNSLQPQCREISISQEEVRLELKKNRIVRALYMTGGTLSLALGIIGIFVPGLPTTPFVLLSAALYAKSSEKLYNWLIENKYLGPRIKNYQRQKGVTLRGKYRIIALMLTMVLISSLLILKVLILQIIILSSGVIGAIVVRFVVPTAKEDADN